MYLSFWAVRKTKVKCSINNVRVLKQTGRERSGGKGKIEGGVGKGK